jgi:outer membrane receptor protein involved in Fe transport
MHRSRCVRWAAAACLVTAASIRASDQTLLEEIVVEDERPRSAASSDDIRARDYRLRPHSTLQEVLNNVPGLVVRQHQGGGKANQYLIRGFNADHGTDFLVTVDGLPVNLPSHGHGQGYADTNFVIPETIERLRLRKGPYFVEEGNFATAGSLDLVTRDEFPEDFVLAEGGSFDRQRYVVGASPRLGVAKTLLAGQAYWSNGPFDHPEHFARYHAYAKLTAEPTNDLELSAAGTYYAADWDASGQIPQREVSAGRLDRFGAIDPTEGGQSDRQNLDLHATWTPTPRDEVALQAWASRYHMRLFSNFTFFQETGLRFRRAPGGLVDLRGGPPPAGGRFAPGDGIEQLDDRWLYGGRATWTRGWELGGFVLASRLGIDTRHDAIDVALHRQVERRRFFTVSDTRVNERTVGFFAGQELIVNEHLRFDGGVRGDVYWWRVGNRLRTQRPDPDFAAVPIHGTESDAIASPKLDVIVSPVAGTEIYLNAGGGFHSNDARGIVQGGGDPDIVPLARAWGYEMGARTRRLDDRLDVAAALWLIDLESEIVFCGDCGTIEGIPRNFDVGPATRRWGIDVEARWRLADWLWADYDVSWADPRFESSGDAIPIAPTLFMNGGLTAEFRNGFSAAARVRFLDDRPGTEDRRVTARGYLVLDLFAKYRWRKIEVGVDLLNLGDFDWQEAVFVDTSCTAREVRRGRCPSRRDVHFTPGDPLAVRGRVVVYF